MRLYGSVIVYMATEMIEDPELPTVARKYNHIFRCIRAKYKDAIHDSPPVCLNLANHMQLAT